MLADALVARSVGRYQGWGDAVIFEACTAARIGEVSGCLVRDINTEEWIWTVRRQTTPSPGGLVDKNTKGKRALLVIKSLSPHSFSVVAADTETRVSRAEPFNPALPRRAGVTPATGRGGSNGRDEGPDEPLSSNARKVNVFSGVGLRTSCRRRSRPCRCCSARPG